MSPTKSAPSDSDTGGVDPWANRVSRRCDFCNDQYASEKEAWWCCRDV